MRDVSPLRMDDLPTSLLIQGPLAQTQAMFTALQARALAAQIVLRAPPPAPTSCCGRGCHGCVWEGFYAAAQHWQQDAELALQAALPR